MRIVVANGTGPLMVDDHHAGTPPMCYAVLGPYNTPPEMANVVWKNGVSDMMASETMKCDVGDLSLSEEPACWGKTECGERWVQMW